MTRTGEIVLVKLGGSLLTDKRRPRALRRQLLGRLAAELAVAARGPGWKLLAGHGSGSFGHLEASRWGLGSGPVAAGALPGVAATQEAAAALHRQVTAALREAGAMPYSLAPSSLLVAAGGRPAWLGEEPVVLALERGLLPVVYGDVVLDRQWGAAICSTETVLVALAERLLARGLPVRRALWLGETEGLYDPGGRLIPALAAGELDGLAPAVGEAAGTDVTGGMRHRLEAAGALAAAGVTSWLLDGRVEGRLGAALAGEPVPGTRISP